jgi:hypothetical protein
MVIEMEKNADWLNSLSRQDLRRVLAEKNACFVLITCGEPTKEGEIEVEMMCGGDESLAAYLVASAHGLIEDDNEQP